MLPGEILQPPCNAPVILSIHIPILAIANLDLKVKEVLILLEI